MVDDASDPPAGAQAESVHVSRDSGTQMALAGMSAEQGHESLQWLDAQLEQVQTAVAEARDGARDAAREFISLGTQHDARIQELNTQLAAMNELSDELAASQQECATWQTRAQDAEIAKEALADELLQAQAATDEMRAERDELALQLRELESRRQEQDRAFCRFQTELQERDDELARLEARLTRLALVEDAVQEARHEAARDEFGVLVRTNGTNEIRHLDLPRMTIGREADNDLRIQESHISRHHAQITRVDDETFIEDLESTNGVYVNGQPVVIRLRVQDGDQVSIGGTEFRYQESMQA
jgi:uncharacterized coiled-coil DUF342 family protein